MVLVVAGHYCIVVASNSSNYLVWVDDDTLHLYCFGMQDDAEKADDGQEPAAALALAAPEGGGGLMRVAIIAAAACSFLDSSDVPSTTTALSSSASVAMTSVTVIVDGVIAVAASSASFSWVCVGIVCGDLLLLASEMGSVLSLMFFVIIDRGTDFRL